MDISLNALMSGMNASQFRVDNVAHNVANVNTEGFEAQRVGQVETTRQAADTYEPTNTGTQVYNAGREEADLTRDMTDLVTDKNTYSANAQAAKMRNDILGTTIDLVG